MIRSPGLDGDAGVCRRDVVRDGGELVAGLVPGGGDRADWTAVEAAPLPEEAGDGRPVPGPEGDALLAVHVLDPLDPGRTEVAVAWVIDRALPGGSQVRR